MEALAAWEVSRAASFFFGPSFFLFLLARLFSSWVILFVRGQHDSGRGEKREGEGKPGEGEREVG